MQDTASLLQPLASKGRTAREFTLPVLRCLNVLLLAAALISFAALSPAKVSAQQEVVVGGRAGPDTPGDIYWKRFADDLTHLSDDRLKAKLFVRGEIGPEETLFMGLRRNTVQLGGISTSGLSLAVPELSVIRIPFLFENNAELEYVLESGVKDFVSELLYDKNLVMFDWQSAGWLNFYSTFPIRQPSDLTNKRMRISVEDASIEFMKALGADFAQISFSDVLPALQTGLLDGGEQSSQLYIIGGFSDYAAYYTLSRHAYVVAVVVGNRRWYDGLASQDQDILRQSVPSDVWYRQMYQREDDSALAKLEADGLNLLTLTEAELAVWKNKVSGLPEQLVAKSGPRARELYDMILAAKRDFAAQSE